MHRHSGITGAHRASIYQGVQGLERGNTVDREIAAWVAQGQEPMHGYSRRLMGHLTHVMRLTELQTQVRVHSATHRWSTAIDIVAMAGPRTPRIIECKTTALTAARFRATYDTVDPTYSTTRSAHSDATVPNTPRRRYTDQLFNGMNMYGVTNSLPSGTPCFGSLVVVCEDGIIEYSCDTRYEPNTGINKPPASRRRATRVRCA